MFMLPERSELKAMLSPSGDQEPRVSSRVLATTAWGSPVGWPVSADTGNLHRSAFSLRTETAKRLSLRDRASSTSWLPPVLSCSGGPARDPSENTGSCHTLSPSPPYQEK